MKRNNMKEKDPSKAIIIAGVNAGCRIPIFGVFGDYYETRDGYFIEKDRCKVVEYWKDKK